MKTAKKAEAEAKSALGKAKEAAENFAGELSVAAKGLDKAHAKLENFRLGALATFCELRERIAPAPQADECAPTTEEPATVSTAQSPPAAEPATVAAVPQTVEASSSL